MKRTLIASVVALALAAAACGGQASPTTTTPPPDVAASMDEMGGMDGMDEMDVMDGMSGMMMGDPHATRADAIAHAALETGPFRLLDSAPAGHTAVEGAAHLARHDGGTTLTVDLSGLASEVDYVGHVHVGACADAGGPHYRHDPDGSELPPNEIHIAFVSGADGSGTMTVENATVAGDDAVSVVIHASGGDKVACADLAPAG